MRKTDLLIIGAGPGGTTAAITATRRRMSVTLVEAKRLGGTCMHEGCVPAKSLVASAKFLRTITRAMDYGVQVDTYKGHFSDFLNRQRQIINKMERQLSQDLEKAGVDVVHGGAHFIGPHTVEVALDSGQSETWEARNIMIACGSTPATLPNVEIDSINGRVISPAHMLSLTNLPSRMVLVGGGYIPCTYGFVLASLGCEVTIVEQNSRLLPRYDPMAGELLTRQFERMGICVMTGCSVLDVNGEGEVKLNDGSTLQADKVLIALGRVPRTDHLNLEAAGLDSHPHIVVNANLQTRQPGIYAVGDVNGMLPLANSAIAQARSAVLHMSGEESPFNPSLVPHCVYTMPEIGIVGMSEQEALNSGHQPVVAKVPFSSVGRALAMGELEGLVKLVADEQSGRLLGGLVVGGPATEIISQITAALHAGWTVDQFSRVITPHPTFCEAIQEACWQLRLNR